MSDHPGSDSLSADVKELLLEEYRSLSTALQTNEQVGETRVNWLIGIVTAVVGGLVAMVTAEKKHGVFDDTLWLIAISFLLGLLLLGLTTFHRIMKRNATTDGFKKDIERIREIFRDYYDPVSILLNYHAFAPPPSRSDKEKDAEKEEDSDDEDNRKFGGLADLVSALNSLVIAVLAGAILLPRSIVLGCCAAVTAFSLSFWLHLKYVRKKHKEVKEKLRPEPFTRAGGVVVSFQDTVPKYLFASSSDDGDKWILPKGKIDEGEDPRETALREVAEETGVRARLLRPLGIMKFMGKAGLVETKFFLMELIFEGKPIKPARKEKPAGKEKLREKKWFSFDEVQEQANAFHPETSKLLTIAERRVSERRRSGEQPEST
jgi:8-oxo-dGTP pyrophosphatase MutT (NUDIX family)